MSAPAGAAQLSFDTVPDEVFITVLKAHGSRCEVRTVARRCRDIIEQNFQIRRFPPPQGKVFCIDFEIDCYMTKHLYCARFGGPSAGDDGGVAGAVTFAKWVPAYLRSNPSANKDVRHRLGETDACALWRLIAKLREQRHQGEHASSTAETATGHLTVSEGATPGHYDAGKQEVIGRLSALETNLVLRVLDHRRNAAAQPMVAVA